MFQISPLSAVDEYSYLKIKLDFPVLLCEELVTFFCIWQEGQRIC